MTHSLPKNDSFLKQVAAALRRRGLRLPALVILEAGRPLAFLGGQALWIAQPVFSLFWSPATVGRMARLLEEPGGIERLIAYLDTDEGDVER